VRLGVLLLMTLLLAPVAVGALTSAPQLTPATLGTEALIGLAIGLGAAIIIGAAEMAGDTMASQMGLSGAAILDPLDGSHLPVLGTFMRLVAMTILLSTGLHEVMLRALAESFEVLPAGSPVSVTGGLAAMVGMGARLFVIGVRLAAPVIAVVFIVTLALAVLSRTAQQLNLLTVSLPVQIAVGLLALSASMPAIARALGGWTAMYRDMLDAAGRGFALAGS
jgi:flagellar biosynthetic protein FliR